MKDKKEEYRRSNEDFMVRVAGEEGVIALGGGVYCKATEQGTGRAEVMPNSIVTLRYRGTFITGEEFDNTWEDACPEAFRVSDLIVGFQIALRKMRAGDRWTVYIPWQRGYGKRAVSGIPGYSTLVFDIQLISVA